MVLKHVHKSVRMLPPRGGAHACPLEPGQALGCLGDSALAATRALGAAGQASESSARGGGRAPEMSRDRRSGQTPRGAGGRGLLSSGSGVGERQVREPRVSGPLRPVGPALRRGRTRGEPGALTSSFPAAGLPTLPHCLSGDGGRSGTKVGDLAETGRSRPAAAAPGPLRPARPAAYLPAGEERRPRLQHPRAAAPAQHRLPVPALGRHQLARRRRGLHTAAATARGLDRAGAARLGLVPLRRRGFAEGGADSRSFLRRRRLPAPTLLRTRRHSPRPRAAASAGFVTAPVPARGRSPCCSVFEVDRSSLVS